MSVLLYGHSQTQATGMGDDMVALLKKAKVPYKRLGLQGRNDKQLFEQKGQLGNTDEYARVVLYCGGNNSKIPDTINLIKYFGEKRVIAVLPPLNIDRVVPDMTLEQRREHAAQYEAAIKPLVPVFRIEGRMPDFKPDEIHLRTGTAVGKELAQNIMKELGLAAIVQPATGAVGITVPAPADKPSGSNIALIAGIGVAALAAGYFFFRK